MTEPLSLHVETFGTGKIPEGQIEKIILDHFDLTPKGIIKTLKLLRPIYKETASFGHFGRKVKDFFTWEETNKAGKLKKAAGL